MTLNESVQTAVGEIAAILGENAPSIYLYGSVALGDFKLGWSDIDILVLTGSVITEESAKTLVGLRQTLQGRYPGVPYFRLLEGSMRSVGAFLLNSPERTVYWGTSDRRVTDGYYFDDFCMIELLDCGVPLYGEDIRRAMVRPAYARLRDNVRVHYETILQYAQITDGSLYSFGWLPDIARCFYTLRTGKIIAKTDAGDWALENGVCPVAGALAEAIRARRDPVAAKADKSLLDYAGRLGADIQLFADALERELYMSAPLKPKNL